MILEKIADRLPCREISDGDRKYLYRYYLFDLFGWRFYLHEFVGSDPGKKLHDHPWKRAFSIVLRGKYIEQTRSGDRLVRWFNALNGDTFHRVQLVDSRPCWTLFFHKAGDVKPWGFLHRFGTLEVDGKEVKGAAMFVPYQYSGGKKDAQWWKSAPRGRVRG